MGCWRGERGCELSGPRHGSRAAGTHFGFRKDRENYNKSLGEGITVAKAGGRVQDRDGVGLWKFRTGKVDLRNSFRDSPNTDSPLI